MANCRVCGRSLYDGQNVCPNCGFSHHAENPHPCLGIGTALNHERYRLENYMAVATEEFPYITYFAWDVIGEETVAIREYYPLSQNGKAIDIRKGKGEQERTHLLFLEAQKQVNTIQIIDCFEENNTFYQVMDLNYGVSIGHYTSAPEIKDPVGELSDHRKSDTTKLANTIEIFKDKVSDAGETISKAFVKAGKDLKKISGDNKNAVSGKRSSAAVRSVAGNNKTVSRKEAIRNTVESSPIDLRKVAIVTLILTVLISVFLYYVTGFSSAIALLFSSIAATFTFELTVWHLDPYYMYARWEKEDNEDYQKHRVRIILSIIAGLLTGVVWSLILSKTTFYINLTSNTYRIIVLLGIIAVYVLISGIIIETGNVHSYFRRDVSSAKRTAVEIMPLLGMVLCGTGAFWGKLDFMYYFSAGSMILSIIALIEIIVVYIKMSSRKR